MTILVNLIYDYSLNYLVILVMLIGTVIVMYNYHICQPYYNENIAKLWSSFASLLVFTAIMLAFANFLESKLFFSLGIK